MHKSSSFTIGAYKIDFFMWVFIKYEDILKIFFTILTLLDSVHICTINYKVLSVIYAGNQEKALVH